MEVKDGELKMDLEDQIAKIIKDEYASTGLEDEGRSTAAAHDIMNLIKETWERYLTQTTDLARGVD